MGTVVLFLGEIVLNTMKDGEWGDEEKYDLLEAFYPGRQFHIQFNVRDDDYEVHYYFVIPRNALP